MFWFSLLEGEDYTVPLGEWDASRENRTWCAAGLGVQLANMTGLFVCFGLCVCVCVFNRFQPSSGGPTLPMHLNGC